MIARKADGLNVPHGDDTHYISRKDQDKAVCLENDGLCRPLRISASKRTSIYLVVWHGQHKAPAHLVLSPFTLPQYPHQTFYGAYLWYTRCCDEGPDQGVITTTLRRVYNIFFPVGKCGFDKDNQQEVRVGAFTELSCHERAQRGLDRLQQGPDSALKRRLDAKSPNSFDSTSRAITERSPKRRRQDSSEQDSRAATDSRQASPQQASPQQASPRQSSPQQASPRQSSPQQASPQQASQLKHDTTAIVKQSKAGLAKLRTKDKDTEMPRYVDLITKLPVQFTDGSIQLKCQSKNLSPDSTTIWELSRDHRAEAKATSWLLRLISSCLSIVEKSSGKPAPPLRASEEKMKIRWANGISMLNRIIDKVGPQGLRLYDAFAKKNYSFSQYAEKPETYRHEVADSVAETILKMGILASAGSRFLYTPYLIWSIFCSKNSDVLSQADVCKALGLESFANFEIHSPFVSLNELQALQAKQMRVEAPQPDMASGTQRMPIISVSRSGSGSAEVQGRSTSNEASGRRRRQTRRSAMRPSTKVNTISEDLGPSRAQRLSMQERLPDRPRRQSVPLIPASANPAMTALNNRIENAAPQGPPAFDVQGQETVVPANSGSPLEQDFPPNGPHSPPPSHRPVEVAHQCQLGYAPLPPPTIRIRPNSPTTQSHGTESPLNRRSGPQGELPIQTPPDSPQPSQQSETETTHQPVLWAPVAMEQANTAAEESSMRDLSPVRSHCHGLSYGIAEIPSQRRDSPPPNPFATQMGQGPTTSQGHVTKISSGPCLESNRAITQEPSGCPQSYQRSEAYTPPQPIPSLPPNVNPAPLEQSQPSPRTTPLILMAAQTTGLPIGISAVLSPPLEFRPENVESDSHVSPNGAPQSPALRQVSKNHTPSSCPSQQPPNAMMADNYWDTWDINRFNFDDLFGMDRIFSLEST